VIEVVKMINIGPKSSAWLRQVGIRSREQLVDAGAIGAFIKIKRAGFKPGLNLLYALEGAILECHWRDLPEGRRGELLSEAEVASVGLPPARGKAMPPAEPVRMIYEAQGRGSAFPSVTSAASAGCAGAADNEDPRVGNDAPPDAHRDED
jgi:DNA transformation protein